jgi:hypothetical protein
MQPRDYKRDAIRVLFVLNAGKTHNTNTDSASLYPSFFRGEKRLQAMDFWVRYPDYRAGSVCLNSVGRFVKWISASIMLPPSSVSAR